MYPKQPIIKGKIDQNLWFVGIFFLTHSQVSSNPKTGNKGVGFGLWLWKANKNCGLPPVFTCLSFYQIQVFDLWLRFAFPPSFACKSPNSNLESPTPAAQTLRKSGPFAKYKTKRSQNKYSITLPFDGCAYLGTFSSRIFRICVFHVFLRSSA